LRVRNVATMLSRCTRSWRELRTQSVRFFVGDTDYTPEALNDNSGSLAILPAILRASWRCLNFKRCGTRIGPSRLPSITGYGSAKALVAERPIVLPP